jgi:F-type H+-transporting ATPase subunit b
MTLDWWTLGLQTINVIVLVWLLARFLFRPVSRMIGERQAAAHTALDEAEAARTEAKAARDAARAESQGIAAERSALIAKAQDEAEAEKRRLLDEARAMAEAARAEGEAELARLRATQGHALTEEAGKLATDIAARLFARLPESARIAGFVDGLADAVGDLPEATRAGIGAAGPVRIRGARVLTDAERDLLQRRLAAVLDRAVTLEIAPDPGLIAGLELDAPHAIVRNHFRADLDRIRAEVSDHD